MMITTFYIPNVPAWAYGWQRSEEQRKGEDFLAVADGNHALSLSNDLAAAGAETGEKIERLRSRFPSVRIVPRDRTIEAIAWEGLLERLNRETPELHAPEIGRCNCRIDDLAVVERLARQLDLYVGSGPDRTTAEFAALTADRGTLNLVDFEHPDRWVGRLPITILAHYRFTPAMIERLGLLGLGQLSSIRRLSKRHLVAQWGAEGDRLWRFLRRRRDVGIPLYRPPIRITAAHRFEIDVLEPCDWMPLLQRMITELVGELEERTASWVTVRLEEGDLRRPEEYARLLPEPSRTTRVIERTAASLLLARPEPLPFALITLGLGGIRDIEVMQVSLFDRRPEILDLVNRMARRFPRVLMRVRGVREEEVWYERRVEGERVEGSA